MVLMTQVSIFQSLISYTHGFHPSVVSQNDHRSSAPPQAFVLLLLQPEH